MTRMLNNDANATTLSRPERLLLLPATGAGRIGFVSPTGLQIVPVCFWRDGGRVFLQTTPDSTLDQLADLGSELTLEVDTFGRDAADEWSVSMTGTLQPVTDGHQDQSLQPGHEHAHQHGMVCLEFVPPTHR
ncbi:MAG: Pyridoxamine 5-phosphate oxidase [Friedmanniella sp.]|nr:Pyridoxamine 5-phosphate oxidase [Friedmanniella sp.]